MSRIDPTDPEADRNVEDLALDVAAVITSMARGEGELAEADLTHLLARTKEVFQRKQEMSGTKSDTFALVAEHLFSRVRRALRTFMRSADVKSEVRQAEWVLGAVIGQAALGDLAAAFDRTMLASSGPQDYSFAGRADFIAIEEVLQMLGSGKHTGCLSLEKHDNRLDIFIQRGVIAFLDPHAVVRRVLPGATPMEYREIGADLLARAQARHREDGTPTMLSLHEAGVFRGAELRGVVRQLGGEVLFDFLRAQEESYFSYRKLDALPDFALTYDLRLGITPILLETTKRLDDWRTLRSVFPDPKAPIKPMPDMLARIASLTLGVVEIKLLTMIDGENSPEKLSQAIGLPITDVYQLLVQLAREGAIEASGRFEGIDHAVHGVQDSLRAAFDALDANDDELAVENALDRVLGGDLGSPPRGGANSRIHLR